MNEQRANDHVINGNATLCLIGRVNTSAHRPIKTTELMGGGVQRYYTAGRKYAAYSNSTPFSRL